MAGGESYTSYINFLKTLVNVDITKSTFKSEEAYTAILEHVSAPLGQQYLAIIQSAPYNMSDADIRQFVEFNDRIGAPSKSDFIGKNGTTIRCSPSSLRYILHALIILRELAAKRARNIVEIGGGYGGLCIAIHYFANMVGLAIDSYSIIDLPEVNVLISKYIQACKPEIKYKLYDANNFGADVEGRDLFLISNYCFTEIGESLRQNYTKSLIPKVQDGFMIWQTGLIDLGYSLPLEKTYEEENPQTSPHAKNYYVRLSRKGL